MSVPKVTAVTNESPAQLAGIMMGDDLISLNGVSPRDVIEYQQLTDSAQLDLVVRQQQSEIPRLIRVRKEAGEPLGVEVSAAIFDRVRTCDNHCPFCFIYQLPKGMRKSLYLKDDDYRLSFLYGNFTTLTRFTELDVERVIDERLGPLFVSIHATDPQIRSQMLRNPKGATSLRWLGVLLEAGIEIHGQVVVCPGINDGEVLEDTLCGVLDEFPQLCTLGVVPLGLSRFSNEPEMRPHSSEEAIAVCSTIKKWQKIYKSVLGRRLVYAADEYYLLAKQAFPSASSYDGFPQHENGIGMVRAFEEAFLGRHEGPQGVRQGFFAWVDGAPAAGYRSNRSIEITGRHMDDRPIAIVTGSMGAQVLAPIVARHDRADVRFITVENRFFGGNIGVAGLMTGEDIGSALSAEPPDHRYLLPDACLSDGRFLDGLTLADLPLPVEVVPTDGKSLRRLLDGLSASSQPAPCGAR